MKRTTLLAEIGALIGDPGRASMLMALLDGRARTAKELAACAGVTPQTASGHLARLLASGLIIMRRQGRHHYHSLGSADIAAMIESMMRVAAGETGVPDGRSVRLGPADAALRRARICYDHLAGRLAVDLADVLAARGHVSFDLQAGHLTEVGCSFFIGFGVDIDQARRRPRAFCRPCLDWSERRPHLAGALGAALMRRTFDLGWLRRVEGSRALAISVAGHAGFLETFGVEPGQSLAPW